MTDLVRSAILNLELRQSKALKDRDFHAYGTFGFAISELKALIA